MRVEFHPAAQQEVEDAQSWYAERSVFAAAVCSAPAHGWGSNRQRDIRTRSRADARRDGAVTKAGLDALTVSLAADLLTSGVTVNGIDPGPIDTGWMTADLRTSLASASPTGSLARPRDLAGVVRLLCADGSAGITGRTIRIQSEGVVDKLKSQLTDIRRHRG